MSEDTEYMTLTVALPAELFERFSMHAEEVGFTLSDLASLWLADAVMRETEALEEEGKENAGSF